jgi:hypothetical protein
MRSYSLSKNHIFSPIFIVSLYLFLQLLSQPVVNFIFNNYNNIYIIKIIFFGILIFILGCSFANFTYYKLIKYKLTNLHISVLIFNVKQFYSLIILSIFIILLGLILKIRHFLFEEFFDSKVIFVDISYAPNLVMQLGMLLLICSLNLKVNNNFSLASKKLYEISSFFALLFILIYAFLTGSGRYFIISFLFS